MKIAIIGGGSLGLLFAHYLNQFHEVCIYVRSKEQEQALLSEGLVFEKNGQSIVDSVNSALLSAWKGQEDLTIIAVKQYHLENVLRKIKEAVPCYSGSLLFLQNGMGHLKKLKDVSASQIYVGAVEHGAKKEKVNHVIHTGNGVTRIAVYKGHSIEMMNELAIEFSAAFPFIFENDYEDMLVKKLIVNSVINPLTAILNVRNGELLDNPYYHRLFMKMYKEISSVLHTEDQEETFAYLEKICRKTAANRSSMLQDLDEKRPTEVDAILGFILEKAGEMGASAPMLEFFYHSIKGKEYEGMEEYE